jgi:hypothetical protein
MQFFTIFDLNQFNLQFYFWIWMLLCLIRSFSTLIKFTTYKLFFWLNSKSYPKFLDYQWEEIKIAKGHVLVMHHMVLNIVFIYYKKKMFYPWSKLGRVNIHMKLNFHQLINKFCLQVKITTFVLNYTHFL